MLTSNMVHNSIGLTQNTHTHAHIHAAHMHAAVGIRKIFGWIPHVHRLVHGKKFLTHRRLFFHLQFSIVYHRDRHRTFAMAVWRWNHRIARSSQNAHKHSICTDVVAGVFVSNENQLANAELCAHFACLLCCESGCCEWQCAWKYFGNVVLISWDIYYFTI